MSAGPRKVSAPGIAGVGTAPQATSSVSYSISAFVDVWAMWCQGSTATRAPGVKLGPDRKRQAVQLEVPDLAELEGRGNSERAVPEARFGGEQLDAHAIRGKVPKRQRRLKGGYPASGDEDPGLAVAIHRPSRVLSLARPSVTLAYLREIPRPLPPKRTETLARFRGHLVPDLEAARAPAGAPPLRRGTSPRPRPPLSQPLRAPGLMYELYAGLTLGRSEA